MAKIKIIHEFDSIEDSYEITTLLNARIFRDILMELEEKMRGTMKHDDIVCESEYFYGYLESLRQIIHEVRLYDDV